MCVCICVYVKKFQISIKQNIFTIKSPGRSNTLLKHELMPSIFHRKKEHCFNTKLIIHNTLQQCKEDEEMALIKEGTQVF